MLQEFIKDQTSKPLNPTRYAIKIPGEFFSIIHSDKVFLNKYLKYEDQYYRKKNPDYNPVLQISDDSKYRNVDEHWFKEVSKLDEGWFVAIKKINKVRNFAAHSFDENRIYTPLGIKGKNKLPKLKKYCKDTLSELISIK